MRKSWFDRDDPSALMPDAFFRRRPVTTEGVVRPRDKDGLSVFRAGSFSPQQCTQFFKSSFGVASLHAGRLKDLGVQVAEDGEGGKKALLVNVPFENPGTAEEEYLAGEIARSARVVLDTRR